MNLKIEPQALAGPALGLAFQDDYARVQAFYAAGPPDRLDSYSRVLDFIRVSSADSRWAMLADTAELATPPAQEKLERFIEQHGVFVATGQQAGLFSGPLYTIYKAITAARVAEALEEKLELPVLPLFTVASEDHDWREINHTYVIDTQNRLRRIAVGEAEAADTEGAHPPIHRILVEPDVEKALGELIDSTPETEFRRDILQPLRDAYRPGIDYGSAFAQLLRHLLRRLPFLVVPGSHPLVKDLTRPLLCAEWEARSESEARSHRRAAELEAAGFSPQVAIPEGATNLFLEGQLGRDRVLYDAEGARLRRSDERLSDGQFRAILEKETHRVSGGALLGPVLRAQAFPVIAHVVGPSEIAYLAQSQVLFALHEVPSPVLVPRASFRLIEAKIGRVLQEFAITAEALAGDSGRAINRLMKEQVPDEVRGAIAGLRKSLAASMSTLEKVVAEFDPGSKSAVASGQKALLSAIKGMETTLEVRAKDKHEVMQKKLEKAALHLYPTGEPQDRRLNIYPYLIRYGEDLLAALRKSVVTPLD